MKKDKKVYDVQKNEKDLKQLLPSLIVSFFFMLISGVCASLGQDLKLEKFTQTCAILLFLSFLYCVCYCVLCGVHLCIKAYKEKHDAEESEKVNEDK